MLELRLGFGSENAWKAWLSTNKAKFCDWRADVLESVAAHGLLEPITGIHRPPESIEIAPANLRGTISVAGLNSRKRAALMCLDIERRNLKDMTARSNPKILGTDGMTRIARILRGTFCYYLGAEHLPTAEEQERHFPIGHADLTDIKFPSETFDLFYSGDIFQYSEDAEKVLHEIARILKPCGIALSTFAFAAGKSRTPLHPKMKDDQLKDSSAVQRSASLASHSIAAPAWDGLELSKRAGFAHSNMTLIASSTHGIASSDVPGVFVFVAKKGEPSRATGSVGAPERYSKFIYRGPDLRKVIGLLALPRCGKTLLTLLLGVQSDIRAIFEPWNANKKTVNASKHVTLPKFFAVFPTKMEGKRSLLIKETSTRIEYLDRVFELLRSTHLPIQRSLIYLLRNPLHVFLSEVEARKTWWGEGNLERSTETLDGWANKSITALKHLLQLGPGFNAILVSYDALVTRKRETIGSLMNLLEIPFEEDQLRFESLVQRSEVRGDPNVATKPKEISTASLEKRAQEVLQIDRIVRQSRYAQAIAAISSACTALEAQPCLELRHPIAKEIVGGLTADLNNGDPGRQHDRLGAVEDNVTTRKMWRSCKCNSMYLP